MRGAAVGVVLVLLAAGTLWGDDDHFPFGPFKMYAGTAQLSDPVHKMQFEGTTVRGETVEILAHRFGMRPAEIEGQLGRIVEDPKLMEALVLAYEKRNPTAPPLVEFRLVHGIYQLVEGSPVGYTEEVLARWRRERTEG